MLIYNKALEGSPEQAHNIIYLERYKILCIFQNIKYCGALLLGRLFQTTSQYFILHEVGNFSRKSYSVS